MKRAKKYEIQDFLMTDLKENGSQSSWDFQADLRFAKFLKEEEAVADLERILFSSAPLALILDAHSALIGKVKNKRLAGLRELVSMGEAESFWMGLGQGSMNQFGAKRVRCYSLREWS